MLVQCSDKKIYVIKYMEYGIYDTEIKICGIRNYENKYIGYTEFIQNIDKN